MRLSDGEKLALFMLSEIYQKLGVDGEIDPKFIAKAIRSGHTWAIKRKYFWIYGESSSDNAEALKDVLAILVMWDVIEAAYDRLTEPEKDELKRQTGLKEVKFGGFDANNEEQHYSILMFLIYDMDEFSTLKGRNLNMHYPVLESYKRMLAVFKGLGRRLSGRNFNAQELVEILNARWADR